MRPVPRVAGRQLEIVLVIAPPTMIEETMNVDSVTVLETCRELVSAILNLVRSS